MARIRSTKPSFFRHEELQDLENKFPESKIMLFYAGLWTLCDNKGRFEWRPKQIKLDILPFVDYDPEATLNLLASYGYIKKYELLSNYYGLVLKFNTHQRLSGKEVTEGEKYPEPAPNSFIEITTKEAPGKQQGSTGEATFEEFSENLQHTGDKDIIKGSTREAPEKHPGAQDKDKDKDKDKEITEKEFSGSEDDIGSSNGASKFTKQVGGAKSRSAAPRKKNPDSEPYWHLIRKKWIWFNKTHLHFNVEPIPKRDYSHIHRVIESLRERAVNQDVEWTEEEALKRWENFMTVAYTKHDFCKKSFIASNLEGQMQGIFQLIENPNGQQNRSANKQGYVDQRVNIDPSITSSGKF